LRGRDGVIPRLSVYGNSLAEAWENAMIALFHYGCNIRTDYDRKNGEGNYIDPPSIDCSMDMTILNPFAEPVIHRAFPGGIEDLEEYRQEVVEGVKNWMMRDPNDPEDKRWEYTYNERLFCFKANEKIIDQMAYVIEDLARFPMSRRAQAVTWQVWSDEGNEHPPCLQRLWFRILPDEKGYYVLNTNMNFRSRDGYDAAFMNDFAFIDMIKKVAGKLTERLGREVKIGAFQDISDSFHIYGHRIADFENRFLKQVTKRSFEDRTWTMEFANPQFDEARIKVANKINEAKKGYLEQLAAGHKISSAEELSRKALGIGFSGDLTPLIEKYLK